GSADTHANGQCTPAAAGGPAPSAPCHDPRPCQPQTGTCSNPAKPSGTSCSDSNACTGAGAGGGDQCNANGQCVPGAAVVCTASDQGHDAGTCEPHTGTACRPAKPSGSSCSDGDAC